MVTAPEGFVQVGWFCDHAGNQLTWDDKKKKCLRADPHVEWSWKRGIRKAKKNHNIIQSIETLGDVTRSGAIPDLPPPCPKAVPVYRRLSDE